MHLCEILLKDFLSLMGISQYKLATAIKVTPRRINEIILTIISVCGYNLILSVL